MHLLRENLDRPLLCRPLRAVALLAAFAASSATLAHEGHPVADASGLSEVDTTEDLIESIQNAITSGTVSLNVRYRQQYADRRGLEDSLANTIRTRLGYKTADFNGLQGYIELEDVTAFDDNRYNSTQNGETERTVIADPETTELNQLWASYQIPLEDIALSVKGGRQVTNLDDQRFIGSVGWRQDDQVLEAVRVDTDFGIEGLSALYAYVFEVNRIFAEAGDFDSNSHLINVAYDIENLGKLTGFIYLLDFQGSSPENSSQTYGLRLAGKRQLNETFSLAYQGSVAFQEDFEDNPEDYDAEYYLIDLALGVKDIGTIGVGFEVLGSDSGEFAFRTPLATLHKFQGFADLFLITPDEGVEDLYVYFKPANLPFDINAFIAYHLFSGNEDLDTYGQELDIVLTKKLTNNLSILGKYASFFGKEPGFEDTTRLTVDLVFKF
ncbi:MAG: alginate export family protein [Planctomycetota bacterium]